MIFLGKVVWYRTASGVANVHLTPELALKIGASGGPGVLTPKERK